MPSRPSARSKRNASRKELRDDGDDFLGARPPREADRRERDLDLEEEKIYFRMPTEEELAAEAARQEAIRREREERRNRRFNRD